MTVHTFLVSVMYFLSVFLCHQSNGVDLGTSYHTDKMLCKLLYISIEGLEVSARQSCAEMAVSREETTSCLRLKVNCFADYCLFIFYH